MQPYRLVVLVARARGSTSARLAIFASETRESFDTTHVGFDRWLGENDRADG